MSLPLWERGLKWKSGQRVCVGARSLPLWERGLKSFKVPAANVDAIVAPLVGAWIEMG